MPEKLKKPVMKLFVWTDFCPDWSGGLAFAIAPDLETAQQMIAEGYNIHDWGELEVFDLSEPRAFSVMGGS